MNNSVIPLGIALFFGASQLFAQVNGDYSPPIKTDDGWPVAPAGSDGLMLDLVLGSVDELRALTDGD